MKLKGSCHCGSVHFSLDSAHPYPFNLCYCSICRKTAGGGGYAINLGGDYKSLKIDGKQYINIYKAIIKNPESGENQVSSGQRHFCKKCGSALWQWDSKWPDLVHPFASAIDTELPTPPEHTHMMLSSKATWVEVYARPTDSFFKAYPKESLADWHQRLTIESQDT